jgi:hypothetical protein
MCSTGASGQVASVVIDATRPRPVKKSRNSLECLAPSCNRLAAARRRQAARKSFDMIHKIRGRQRAPAESK